MLHKVTRFLLWHYLLRHFSVLEHTCVLITEAFVPSQTGFMCWTILRLARKNLRVEHSKGSHVLGAFREPTRDCLPLMSVGGLKPLWVL